MRLGLYGDIASVTDDTVHTWLLTCMDTSTGKVLFETKMHEGVPKVKRHTNPRIRRWPPTARTSSAMLGSEGLFAFDMKGKQIWKVDLGVLDSGFFMVPAAQWELAARRSFTRARSSSRPTCRSRSLARLM